MRSPHVRARAARSLALVLAVIVMCGGCAFAPLEEDPYASATPVPCETATASPRVTMLTEAQAGLVTRVTGDSVTFSSSVALRVGDLIVAESTAVGGALVRLVTEVGDEQGQTVVTTCALGGSAETTDTATSIPVDDGTTVTIPSGAFPVGTRVWAVPIAAPGSPVEVASVTGLVPAERGVLVMAEGGLQPSVPVRLTLPAPTPASGADDVGYVVAALSSAGTYDYFSASVDQQTDVLSVEVAHFTSFWSILVRIGEFVDQLTRGVQNFLGLVYDPPDCYREDRIFSLSGTDYLIGEVDRDVAYLCLKEDSDGTPSLTLSSNYGAAFRVGTTPEGVAAPMVGLDLDAMIVQAFMNLIDPSDGQAPIMYSGATLDIAYPEGEVPSSVDLDIDPGPTLAGSLLYGLSVVATVFGYNPKLLDYKDMAQCIFSGVEDGMEFAKDRVTTSAGAGFIHAAIDCFTAKAAKIGLSTLGNLVLGVLGTGLSLISSGIAGIVAEINGSAHQTVRIVELDAGGQPINGGQSSASGAKTCPFPEPLSASQLVQAGASCVWGYTEYCDCA